jgi:hypothetical protein
MKNLASFNRAGTAVIGSISTATTYSAATKTSASPVVADAEDANLLAPNNAYYSDTTFGRDVYLFVEKARITDASGKTDTNLQALVNPTLNKLANTETNGASKVGKVKLAYGFLAPSSTTIAFVAPTFTAVKS